MEKKFCACSIPLKDIRPNSKLPGDIYLCVLGKFIKFKMKGDQIPLERYEQFFKQKMQYFFIDINDLKKFESWVKKQNNNEKDDLLQRTDGGFEDLISLHLDAKDEFLKFLTAEITNEGIENLLNRTRDFITEFKKDEHNASKILTKIISYNEGIGNHSLNVANLSVYLAHSMGYTTQTALERLYIGALLHDYGKVVIDINSINPIKLPQKYIKELRRHPDVGRISLLMESGISTESIQIIHQHHERFDGKGFPKGLKGNQIYELTKIVSIANYFDNVVSKGVGELKVKQVNALNQLNKDDGILFDPKVLNKCLNYLKPVVTEAS